MGIYQAELRRTFAAPRSLVWAIVADTNRIDRAVGLAVPSYRWVRDADRVVRHGSATEVGVAVEWLEPPYRWVEGRYVEGFRKFIKGPVRAGGFEVQLRDVEGGTEAHARLWVEGPLWVGMLKKPGFARGLSRYFDAVQSILEGADPGPGGLDEPAVVRVRRLLAQTYEPIASGPRTPVHESTFALRAEKMRSAPVEPAIVKRLVAWLRERPDDDVSQIRPFELADLWNVDRRETLRAFLYATQCGLVDLCWQVTCPVCRVGAQLVDHLAALDGRSHCAACDIDYAVDFARYVEAVFPVNPAVRRVRPALYCASSPAFLPHVFAQLRIDPGQARTDVMDLPAGALHLRTLWVRRTADIELAEAPAVLRVRVGDDRIEVRAEGKAEPGAPTTVLTENATSQEIALLFERGAWTASAVLGTAIASMPEFVNLFATEAPAVGVELGVSHIAILFSDLTGSTALYERVGDARAFAVVQEHFKLLEEVITAHGGAMVKTMGDAVMASFPTAREAVAAALTMIEAHNAKLGGVGMGLKVGVHAGPCLAVRANDRLDYFGTTVNLAARLQAQARADELVLAQQLAEQPSIHGLIGALPRRFFEASLKGIQEQQRLVGIMASSLARHPSRPNLQAEAAAPPVET